MKNRRGAVRRSGVARGLGLGSAALVSWTGKSESKGEKSDCFSFFFASTQEADDAGISTTPRATTLAAAPARPILAQFAEAASGRGGAARPLVQADVAVVGLLRRHIEFCVRQRTGADPAEARRLEEWLCCPRG